MGFEREARELIVALGATTPSRGRTGASARGDRRLLEARESEIISSAIAELSQQATAEFDDQDLPF